MTPDVQRRIMRALCCLILLASGTPAWAEWRFLENWTDPIQNFDTRAATITNDDGYQLHLYRNPVGRVYALITLPEGTPDLVRTGAVATLTPEGFAAKDVKAQDERGRVVEYAISTGRALRDRLWHGEGQAPAFGTLRDLLDAPSLTATLTLDTGDTATTTWPMEGAAKPVAQALGIPMGGIPAGEAWEEAASQAMLAAMTACQFPGLDVICVQKVSTCSARISDDRDIDAFEACVAQDD